MAPSVKKALISFIIFYSTLVTILYVFQRSIEYQPSGKLGATYNYALDDFIEQGLIASDGVKIISWYRPAKASDEDIILYFHGNGGNLGDRANKFRTFSLEKFAMLAISYRGYPGSQGNPTEEGIAALKFVKKQGFSNKNIIFYGESLGSGVATRLASEFNPKAVILESPFSSALNVAKKTYWYVWLSLLMKDKYESINYVDQISSPFLIFHGTNDKIVSYSEGKKLFDAISSKKKLITIEGGGHLDVENEYLVQEIKKFLDDLNNTKVHL